jgi:hypothetical protein
MMELALLAVLTIDQVKEIIKAAESASAQRIGNFTQRPKSR